jgi:hypothetical protein
MINAIWETGCTTQTSSNVIFSSGSKVTELTECICLIFPNTWWWIPGTFLHIHQRKWAETCNW